MSPLPNRVILVAVRNKRTAGTPTVPVLSGTQCGLTWTQLDTVVYDTTTQERITLFKANGSGAIAGTLQFTFGGTTQNGCQWVVLELQLADDTGGSALVQTVQASSSGSTQASATLSAFGDTDNATIGIFAKTGSGSWSAGTGFTQVSEQSFATGRMISEWRQDNDTSVDTSTFTSSAWGGWGIEVKAAADPSLPSQLLTSGLAQQLGDPTGSAVYVSYLHGNDTTGDGSSGNPYKTIDQAATVVGTSGIVRLKWDGGSPHQPQSGERATFQAQGKSISEPILIETDPADNPNYKNGTHLAWFKGELLVGDTSNRAYSNIRIRNLKFTKLTAHENTTGADAIRVGAARNIEIERCWFTDTNQSVIQVTAGISRVENCLIHHCRFYDYGSFGASHNSNYNHDHAIYWGGQRNGGGVFGGAVWNNLVFRTRYGKSMQLWADNGGPFPSAQYSVFGYNTMYDVGNSNAAAQNGWHMSLGAEASPGVVNNIVTSNMMVNNLIAFSSREAVLCDATGTGNQINNNLVYNIQNANKFDPTGTSGNVWTESNNILEQNPGFTDPDNGDFHIQSTSPAYNAGQSAFKPVDDYYGTTRSTSDIGAIAADTPIVTWTIKG